MRIVSDRCAFPPDAVMPVYQTDKLRHCLGSLFASLSERGWVNMLPMHERLFMGRPIVPRVRQVVNCLLFAHYLSVTWTRQGKRELPIFSHTRGGTDCADWSQPHVAPVTSPSSEPAAVQRASKCTRLWCIGRFISLNTSILTDLPIFCCTLLA